MSDLDRAADIFIIGLKNAHAMENQALSIMNTQVSRLEHYQDMKARLETHITETEGQIRRLEEVPSHLREKHSAFKDMSLSIGGSVAALTHAGAGDEVLKDSFANYAFEHYEIAAYRSLMRLADIAAPSPVCGICSSTR